MTHATDERSLCSTEFIQLVASAAQEIAEKANRTGISVDHLIKAIEQLGYKDMALEIRALAAQEAALEKKAPKRKRKRKLDESKLDEIAQRQQAIFAKARAAMAPVAATVAVAPVAAAAAVPAAPTPAPAPAPQQP